LIRYNPDYELLEMERFILRHHITRFRFNPFFPINTLALMRGAIAAGEIGVFERYGDEGFRHMWAEPKKPDDPEGARAALLESGVDAARRPARARTPAGQAGPGGQGGDARQRPGVGRGGQLGLPDVLRRRRDLLREGPAAGRRGSNRGGRRGPSRRRLSGGRLRASRGAAARRRP